MNDTPPDIEDKMREMIMTRSGAERMIMGSSMFDAARAIVIASLPTDLPDDEFKRRLFERIYGASMETGSLDCTGTALRSDDEARS